MENLTKENENTNTLKQRHGCVTAWLILMIIGNSFIAVAYLFATEFMSDFMEGIPKTMIVLLGIFSIANVVFAVMLFRFKKFGFWGFVGTSIVVLVINLSADLGIGQSISGLIGIAILYGILQIKKDNVTTWENLE